MNNHKNRAHFLQTINISLQCAPVISAPMAVSSLLAGLAPGMQIRQKYRTRIINKCARLNYRFIEDAGSWNLITRVSKDLEQNIFDGYSSFMDLISIFINVIGVLAYISMASWRSTLVVIPVTVPLIYFSVKSGRANYEVNRTVSQIERRYNYLREMMLDREYVDERVRQALSLMDLTEAVEALPQGNHEQLLAEGGVYANMYREQAKWHVSE